MGNAIMEKSDIDGRQMDMYGWFDSSSSDIGKHDIESIARHEIKKNDDNFFLSLSLISLPLLSRQIEGTPESVKTRGRAIAKSSRLTAGKRD